jgi:hypothetical protein
MCHILRAVAKDRMIKDIPPPPLNLTILPLAINVGPRLELIGLRLNL